MPVKSGGSAKSRLGRSPQVARAIALDTVEAALGAGVEVLVVTADAEVADAAAGLGAHVVAETQSRGLDAAIDAGLDAAGDGARAVLLGDLPALRPEALSDALRIAASHDRAFVADAEGTGSTLVTARAGLTFQHAFGDGSAARHRELGLVELPADASLRRDVDLGAHLDAVIHAGLGPRTSSLVE